MNLGRYKIALAAALALSGLLWIPRSFAACDSEHKRNVEYFQSNVAKSPGELEYLFLYRIGLALKDRCTLSEIDLTQKQIDLILPLARGQLSKQCLSENSGAPLICSEMAELFRSYNWLTEKETEAIRTEVFRITEAAEIQKKKDRCGQNKDYRSKLPPVWDQSEFRETNWCYAFSSAAIASFEIGKEISPIDLGASMQRRDFLTDLKIRATQKGDSALATAVKDLLESQRGGGGYPYLVIENALKKGGFCEKRRVDTVALSQTLNGDLKGDWDRIMAMSRSDEIGRCRSLMDANARPSCRFRSE